MVVKTMPRNQQNEIEATNQENVSKEILIIAQEVEIVKSLACNDLTKRNRQLKRLRKWFTLRSRSSYPFTEEDFRRIWKGLYYTMWMSDKPLVQEDLAEQLGKLLLCFEGSLEASTNFFGAFLFTMYNQWFGVDQWRIDKFMMLVRRMLRYMFRVLKDAYWSSEGINLFNKHLTKNVFSDKLGAAGLTMHILDIFCEELAKVANGAITEAQVGQFIRPFVEFYCTQRDCKLTSHCRTRIFYHLLYQSALGREYMDKYNAWKEMGFPTASINDLEKAEETNTDDEVLNDNEAAGTSQQQLDPRAGNVDVYMTELPINVSCIIDGLKTFLYKNEANTKRRKQFIKLIEICKTFQNGEFPLGIKRMPRVRLEPKNEVITAKIDNLDIMETEAFEVGRKLKQMNKRKRRKLLNSIDFQNVDEENFDKVVQQAFPQNLITQRKRKAREQLMNGWIEEDIDEDLTPKAKKPKKLKPENSVKSTDKATEVVNKNDGAEKQKNQAKSICHKIPLSNEPAMSESISQPVKKKHAGLEKQEKETSKNINTKTEETPTTEKLKTHKATKATDSAVGHQLPEVKAKQANSSNEWGTPLKDGEIEYFIPSRKLKMKKANSELVLNPLAMKKKMSAIAMMSQQTSSSPKSSPRTPASTKRVKIALKHNTEQKPSEYLRQIKCSPNLPYDANKKPGKGLLKPHSIPSPINPFYKKKIGLRLLNDTI